MKAAAVRVLPAIPEGRVIKSKCYRRDRRPLDSSYPSSSSSSASSTLALLASILCLVSILFLRIESDLGGAGSHSAFFRNFEASSMMSAFVDDEHVGFATSSSNPANQNQEAIHIWQTTWEHHGFKTRLLMASDARKHPMYHTAEAILHRPLSPEQNHSFTRSLAMAQTGGGWLTEADIFPIADFSSRKLPNNGKLTIHGVDNTTMSPSLISGDADEWLAYAWDVLDAATSPTHHFDEGGGPIKQYDHVIRADRLMNMNMSSKEGCKLFHGQSNVYAAHFSAEAIENTDDDNLLGGIGMGARFRSALARTWLEKYRKQCRRTRRSSR